MATFFHSTKRSRSSKRTLRLEHLESRQLFAGLPDYQAVMVNLPDVVTAGEYNVPASYHVRNNGPGNGGRFIETQIELINT